MPNSPTRKRIDETECQRNPNGKEKKGSNLQKREREREKEGSISVSLFLSSNWFLSERVFEEEEIGIKLWEQ